MQHERQTRRALRGMVQPLVRFLRAEGTGGLVLALAAAAALIWANWPALPSYEATWRGAPRFVVNDGMMTAFFYLAGLELRRERSSGELRERARAILPVVAAIGGMIAPALIYLAIARGGAARGWGIPVATDLAFALGVIAIVGRGLPVSLRVFLLALAIIDDLGAIIVIAVFYSHDIAISGLVVVAIATAAVLALRRRVHLLVLAVPAVLIWLGLAHAHVHPTLAGVILGMLVPAEPERATRVEQALHPWVAFGVMPVFALANAGIDLRAPLANTSVLVAVAAGLVVGKTLGITGATALAVRLGIAKLPQGASWHGIVLVAAVAGIGFTMSLFVAGLAFGDRPDLEAAARLGMLVGSALAVAVAVPCSYLARRQRTSNESHARRG